MHVDDIEDTEMTDDEKMTEGEIEKEWEAAIDFGGFHEDSKSPEFHRMEHLAAVAFGLEAEEATNDEADFALLMTKLLTNLTESDRSLLAELMTLAVTSRDPQCSI